MMRAPNALALPTMGQPQQVYYDANGNWQWQPYATGGALRPDSFTGMNPEFNTALERLFAEAPPEIRSGLQVYSGYRSPERQAELWENAVREHGSEAAARRWVAPPGRSQHNHGNAADLRFASDEVRNYVHQNAGNYGLAFPLSNENWHIELASARGANPTRGGNASATPDGLVDYTPGTPQSGPQNALALAEAQNARALEDRRQSALNALSQAFARPVYDNVMKGSPR
jgi:hypothetical protein